MAAPPRLKVRDGYNRYLIRGALQGVLPEKIRWRTSTTPFSPDYQIRYNSQLKKARDFVAAIGRGDPVRCIIDVDRLSAKLKPIERLPVSLEATALLPGTIYSICFLRQFPEFRA